MALANREVSKKFDPPLIGQSTPGSMGGDPRWFLKTLLRSPRTSKTSIFGRCFQQGLGAIQSRQSTKEEPPIA